MRVIKQINKNTGTYNLRKVAGNCKSAAICNINTKHGSQPQIVSGSSNKFDLFDNLSTHKCNIKSVDQVITFCSTWTLGIDIKNNSLRKSKINSLINHPDYNYSLELVTFKNSKAYSKGKLNFLNNNCQKTILAIGHD